MTQRIAAIIPSHDHHRAVPAIVGRLREAGLRVFIVDDGSGEEAAIRLGEIADAHADVTLFRFDANQGKGAAVMRGFELAAAEGYSHALQIDADGQHDLDALPRMLALAAEHPGAVVTAIPVFDRTAPLARRAGRWLTHVWVWIETLSFQVRDSMCGFRIYPLAPVLALMAEERIGRRMDFDTDILVRLVWRGLPVLELLVPVTYPADNHSNFDIWHDNLRIGAMHARLVLGMLGRQMRSFAGRIPASLHWASLPERGVYAGLRLAALLCRWLGRETCLVLLTPAVFYFYVTGRSARLASRRFLARAFAALDGKREPGFLDGLRHFQSFARRAVETLAGWTGDYPEARIRLARPEIGKPIEDDPRGAILIVSHLGNADLARIRVRHAIRRPMSILVHTRHAANWTRLLRCLAPDALVDLIEVSEIGPDTAILLKERIDAGHWVAIAGDRTPIRGGDDWISVPFLGAPAPFPTGPYLLAHLLGCPCHFLVCLRRGRDHLVWLEPFAERLELPRGARREALAAHTARYAARLEKFVRIDPFQWFNFHDFWREETRAAD